MGGPAPDPEGHGTSPRPSAFSCPECEGALWEIEEGDLLTYRCRVGHGWAAEAVLAQQAHLAERALWGALRALQERTHLADRLATHERRRGREPAATRLEQHAGQDRRHAAAIRELVTDPEAGADQPG